MHRDHALLADRAEHSSGRYARLWARVRPWVVGAFFVLVAGLLLRLSRTIDWAQAWQSLLAYRPGTLLLGAGLALASYAVYCTYDLLGRHQTGHGLPAARVIGIGFVSYAFNLNLGSLVGGVAMRYRLYSRLGVGVGAITEVLALSLITNWLGYLFVGGLVFALSPLQLPPQWKIGNGGLHLLGAGMLVAAAVYIGACWLAKRRTWRVRGRDFELPSGRIAVGQLGLSSVNWMLIAGVVFVLLRDAVDYVTVLAVLLIAAVAGVVAHIPAGLGVLEAVFLALLSHRAGQGELMAALLAYRALYYLAPLALATIVFATTGMGARPKVVRQADTARRGT